jgi:putative phosphoesterase
MGKIGILSDTHLDTATDSFKTAIKTIFSDVDIIIHAGDMTGIGVYEYLCNWDLRAVRGNMDCRELQAILPYKRIEEINGKKIGIMHGKGPPYFVETLVYSEFQGVDAIIFGHSHMPLYTKRDNIVMFNPGSFRKPVNPPGTAGIMEIDDNQIIFRLLEVK